MKLKTRSSARPRALRGRDVARELDTLEPRAQPLLELGAQAMGALELVRSDLDARRAPVMAHAQLP